MLTRPQILTARREFAGLPTMARNRLMLGGYWTCQQVACAPDADLLPLRGLGAGTLRAIRRYIPYAPGRMVCPTCQGEGYCVPPAGATAGA